MTNEQIKKYEELKELKQAAELYLKMISHPSASFAVRLKASVLGSTSENVLTLSNNFNEGNNSLKPLGDFLIERVKDYIKDIQNQIDEL